MARSQELQDHFDRVGSLRCLVSGRPNPTLHHCKAGSMTPIIGVKGCSLKSSDWLVIPLDVVFHTGAHGIDQIGVETWEDNFGTQVSHLDILCLMLGYNVWIRAGFDRDIYVKQRSAIKYDGSMYTDVVKLK